MCYELASGYDEVCVLEGPVCWDTSTWGLRVGVAARGGGYAAAVRHNTQDPRWATPALSFNELALPNLPPAAYAAPKAWAGGGGDTPRASAWHAIAARSAWGAEMGLALGEAPWESLAAGTSAEDLARLGPSWAAAAAGARGGAADGPGGPSKVSWLLPRPGRDPPGGAAYLSFFHDTTEFEHVYHLAWSLAPWWAAKRLNASEEAVSGPGEGARRRRAGGGVTMPPISAAVYLGDYHEGRVSAPSEMGGAAGAFNQGLLPLFAQPGTRHVFNANMAADADLRLPRSPTHWLCAPRAVTGSHISGLFASDGDASAFRALAYALAGIEAPAMPAYPPRRISIMQRAGSRGLDRLPAIEALLEATGLEWGYIAAATSEGFEAQVRAFAATGILIAPHGAGLVNIAFMPAHAVLIELFPAFFRPTMYGVLAARMDLRYYPLISARPSASEVAADMAAGGPKRWALYANGPSNMGTCDGPASHPSNIDIIGFTRGECHSAKWAHVNTDIQALTRLLPQALDDIGCRDSYCAQKPGGPYVRMNEGGKKGVRKDYR